MGSHHAHSTLDTELLKSLQIETRDTLDKAYMKYEKTHVLKHGHT